MASHLDLEEQEQLDQLKHFWNRYGNLITSLMLVVALAMAGWQGWQWWQRDQASKASGMYEELERAAQAGEVDKVNRVAADLTERYGRTAYAEQGALLAARVQHDKSQGDAARKSLTWVVEHATHDEYQAIGRLRLAGLLLDDKKADEALKLLEASLPESFRALAADRRGDALAQLGKKEEAVQAYQAAWKQMPVDLEYRRIVGAKLTALGAAPAEEGAAAPVAASGSAS